LALGANNVLSDTGNVTVNGGTLNLGTYSNSVATVSLQGGGTITATSATATLTSSATYDLQSGTASAILAGSQGAKKSTPGTTVTLTGANTYEGVTNIEGGTLKISTSTNPASAGSLRGGNYTYDITIASAAVLQYSSSAAQTFAGVISGAGSLVKDGNASTLVLTGADTYSGGTTISLGTLQVGAGGIIGSVSASGSITNNAVLAFNRSDTVSFAGAISGSGALTHMGAGTTTLTGTNTYTGGTNVTGGRLQLSSTLGGGNYTGTISISSVATLEYSASAAQTFTGAISGAGALLKNTGDAALVLTSNASSYSGPITVSKGRLQVASSGVLGGGSYAGTVSLASAAVLQYSSSAAQTFGGAISGAGAVVKDTGAFSTLLLTGANTYTGGTTISAGTLQLASSGVLSNGGYSGAISIASAAVLQYSSSLAQTLSGIISGAGSVLKDTKSSSLVLTGANTYTGGITISAGTLQLASSGVLGNGGYGGAISIASTAVLQYSSSAAQTFGGAISGAGALVKDTDNSSTLLLTAANT
jgi:autotransporter-associated beta strand protein